MHPGHPHPGHPYPGHPHLGHPYPGHPDGLLTYGPPRPARPPLRASQPALMLSAVALVAAVVATAGGLALFVAVTTGAWGGDRGVGPGGGSAEAEGYLLVMVAPGLIATAAMLVALLVAGILYRVVAVGMSRERPWARIMGFVLAGLGLLGALSLGQAFQLPVIAIGTALVPDPVHLGAAGLLAMASLLWGGYFGTTIWWIVAAARATPGGRAGAPAPAEVPRQVESAPTMGVTFSGS